MKALHVEAIGDQAEPVPPGPELRQCVMTRVRAVVGQLYLRMARCDFFGQTVQVTLSADCLQEIAVEFNPELI